MKGHFAQDLAAREDARHRALDLDHGRLGSRRLRRWTFAGHSRYRMNRLTPALPNVPVTINREPPGAATR